MEKVRGDQMKSLSVKLGAILIGVFIISCGEAWPEDWTYYGRTEKSLCFYDAKSLTHPSENIVEVLEKEEFTNKGVNFMAEEMGKKYENLSHLITLWEINCGDKKFRFLSLTYYSKEKTVISSRRVVYSSQFSEEWSPFITHSLGERLYQAVCK